MSDNNKAIIVGKIQGEGFKFFYHNQEGIFYKAIIEVPRLNDKQDYIPVVVPKEIAEKLDPRQKNVEVKGHFSSYGPKNATTFPKIKLFLRADSIVEKEEGEEWEHINYIYIKGKILKEPLLRITSLGKRIAEINIAVDTEGNHKDFIPCIAWEGLAEYVSYLERGEEVELEGRIQSREYFKKFSPYSEKGEYKTAYEISIFELKPIYN